jgi:hypothetical protein
MDLNYLSYSQTTNLVENATYVDLSHPIVLKEISSDKIIKGISILFLIAIFNYIFPYERYKYDSNYKLYVILFAAFLLYLIYLFDLYLILILIFVVIVFIVPPIVILYYYLKKQKAIIKFFYSYNNQVIQVFGNNINSFELLFNILLISIIFILSIVLYWDNIYFNAKKLSKCGRILKIIEDNTFKKKPYVYNIILLDNNSLDTKTSNNILKITYDFMKMKTIIEYNKANPKIYNADEEKKYKDSLRDRSIIIDNIKTLLLSKIDEKKNIIKNIEENDNVSDAITKISNIENIFNIKTRDFVIKLIKEKQELNIIIDKTIKITDSHRITIINNIIKEIKNWFVIPPELDISKAKTPKEQDDIINEYITKYVEIKTTKEEKKILLQKIIYDYIYPAANFDDSITYEHNKPDLKSKIDALKSRINNMSDSDNDNIGSLLSDIMNKDKLKDLTFEIDYYYSNLYENRKFVNYFNLQTMNLDIIENIDPLIIEDILSNVQQKYKFLCVDENNNPVYDYSSKELSKFTKNYAINPDYIPNILHDIIYAKINNNKVFV